ncbi:MAG: hypothetical protein EOO17_04440 [Chloroflexi bacterium]|nr:MAG: hypothetical protein EOO17_04440 [Chloroflexota bacterium]
MQFSPIQDAIISRLKNADSLKYSQLKPHDIANDLYNYHLKFLIKKQYIEKTNEGYRLSYRGIQHVADIHHTNDQANRLFKINVITIVSRISDGRLQILSQTRGSQPSYGKIGVMGGTIIKGEPILQGATRKLQQETGLTASFELVVHERRMLYGNNKLFSDILFPICYATSYSGELVDTDYGHNFWTDIDSAIDNEQKDSHDSIQSIVYILQAIRDGNINTLPLFYNETIK